jgi:alpha-galactosidase
MVIDAGWQARAEEHSCSGGPWHGNADFPDMPGLADAMRGHGVRPGIWTRPLAVEPDTDARLLLPMARVKDEDCVMPSLDPSIPENLARIEEDFRRYRAWGYTLIKQDFSTYDLMGRFGFLMDIEMTNPGWAFADETRTTAEIVLDLYRTVRRGAGDAVVIGCNTFSHLAAGLFELQRTGGDTSGLAWERTRKMGINTLAFRMMQHEALYAVDADCVGLTSQVPWELNRQWLDVLARSGTPLFISADPRAIGPEQAAAIASAFEIASRRQPIAEPLDWLETTCPQRWNMNGAIHEYTWLPATGAALTY